MSPLENRIKKPCLGGKFQLKTVREAEFVMKYIAVLFTFVVFSSPALAYDTEEIGMLRATFDGQAIELPTMIVKSESEESPSAYMIAPGGGFTNLTLTGLTMENTRLDISAGFLFDTPSPEAKVLTFTIGYAPTGTGQRWTSDEAPTPPIITFTTLENDDVQGRAAGTFTGELCYADGYEAEADPANCKPIEGSFDTQFFME